MVDPNYYWTEFGFAEDHVYTERGLHCTHKFFGPLSVDQVMTAAETIVSFRNKMVSFSAIFNTPTLFGRDLQIPVLILDTVDEHKLFPDLKATFDKIVPDEFSPYHPHMTVDGATSVIACIFTHYRFRSKNEKTLLEINLLTGGCSATGDIMDLLDIRLMGGSLGGNK